MTDAVGVGISPPIIRDAISKIRARLSRKRGLDMFLKTGAIFGGK